MFGWINSIKEKSKEVVQLYKNELSNMVYQLDEDIKTLKTNVGGNKDEVKEEQIVTQEMSNIKLENQTAEQQSQSNQNSSIEKKILKKNNIINLLLILQEYDKNIQNNEDNVEFLVEQIDFIENSIDTYFSKDPKQLVMIERDDFTNFHVFEEVPNIEHQAARLLSVNVFKNLPNEAQVQKRVLYFLIYQFHEKVQYSLDQQNNNNNNSYNVDTNREDDNEQDEGHHNQFLRESDVANIISQSSIEEQEEGNNQKFQKRKESNSPKNSQEEDNWEIDDKMIAI